MLGKLIKHEFRSSYRIYLPIYGAVLFMSLLAAGGSQIQESYLWVVALSLLMLELGAMGIFTIYNLIVSLGVRVYGKPGYLLFAVPAKTWHIILSKALVNFIWMLSTLVVSACSMWIAFRILFQEAGLGEMVIDIIRYMNLNPTTVAMVITYGIVIMIYQIGFFMFLFALLNLIYHGEKKLFIGVLLYFGLGYVVDLVLQTITGTLFPNFMTNGLATADFWKLWVYIGVYGVIAAVFYGLTHHFMEKKMELQ